MARSHSLLRRLWQRQMNGDERRRAGGVHGEAGPLQIKEIGDPVWDDTVRGAGAGVRVDARPIGKPAASNSRCSGYERR